MNKRIPRKSLVGALALAATLAAPLAFAQSTDTAADPAAQDSMSAAPAAQPAKKSWNDIDVDQSGDISKTEAAAMPALTQVFDQADANADGALTADEYKNYVAKVQSGTGAGAPPQG